VPISRGSGGYGPPAAQSLLTSFPATENPISESSAWTNATVFTSGSKTGVQTGSGNAYGTMVSHTAPAFEDSAAHLAGSWPADHEVTVTLSNSAAPDGLEAEILLRADFTSAHAVCYEVDCYKAGGGIALVRWDNTTGSPESFTVLRNYVASEVALANGDQVRARIQGTLITVWYRAAAGSWGASLFTYDTASDGTKYASGRPGIGFWNETGVAGNQSKFAWADFLATGL
jgi:hypothetical protein